MITLNKEDWFSADAKAALSVLAVLATNAISRGPDLCGFEVNYHIAGYFCGCKFFAVHKISFLDSLSYIYPVDNDKLFNQLFETTCQIHMER